MNAKYRILCLREMFIKYTDENHYMSINQILDYLQRNGCQTNDKTLRGDFEDLKFNGMEIEYIGKKGYHLKRKSFNLSILKIFADAIASFRFLTVKDSEKLLKLLESLCSIYEVPQLRREIRLTNRIKSDNEQIFKSIDVINTAFRNNQQISFDYYDYNVDKQQVIRGDKKRICLPCALVMKNEQYYMVSHYEKYADTYTNFRLDRMKNIKLIEKSKNEVQPENLNLEDYIKSSFSIFGGRNQYVTVRLPLENKYCNIVIDSFGKSVIMLRDKKSEKHFTAHVPFKADYPHHFFTWIFSLNNDVEILEPNYLSTRYTELLMRYCIQSYA